MTWGQIRFLLQQFAGGVSLDLIDQKINGRYEQLLSLMEWKGLEVTGFIESIPSITTGTVTLSFGSQTVIGSGTAWPATVDGMEFIVPGSNDVYTVSFIDAQTLQLDRAYLESSAIGSGYILFESVYQLPADCRQLISIADPFTGIALIERTELWFAQNIGIASTQGCATTYIPLPDLRDPTTNALLAKRIRLYEVPTLPYYYPILYEQLAPGFDGTNTSASPLEFISSAALLDGCKADLEMEKDSPNVVKYQAFQKSFDTYLQGMTHEEISRKGPQELRMDPHYTRHRVTRYLRSIGGSTRIDDGPD